MRPSNPVLSGAKPRGSPKSTGLNFTHPRAMNLTEIYTRIFPAARAEHRNYLLRQEDRSLWDNYVWPIAKQFRARRYLDEGLQVRSRPSVRLVHAKIGYFIEVELLYPKEPNRYAVHPDDLSKLSDQKVWFVEVRPRPAVLWRKATIRELKNVIEELLRIFTEHRLDLQSGPLKPVYLRIPFERKDWAKGFGARWDPDARLWWIPEYMLPDSLGNYLFSEAKGADANEASRSPVENIESKTLLARAETEFSAAEAKERNP